MKTNYYFIRHGETDGNVKKIWQGKENDSHLTENGKQQAKILAEHLDALYLERIYSSNLDRALETANIISMRCDVPLLVRSNLREADFGEADGLPIDEVFQKYPKIAQSWFQPTPENFDNNFLGGESIADVLARVFPLMDKIFHYQKKKEKEGWNYDGWKVGLVSHAGVIVALMAALGVESPTIDNCEVVHIVRDEEGYSYQGKISFE